MIFGWDFQNLKLQLKFDILEWKRNIIFVYTLNRMTYVYAEKVAQGL